MANIDNVVHQLSEVTDALLAVATDDFEQRYQLLQRRDRLRAEAEAFHERKDESAPVEDLMAELAAHNAQLTRIRRTFLNRATQASSDSGGMAGTSMPLGTKYGGNFNAAISKASGTAAIQRRITEIEQELQRR